MLRNLLSLRKFLPAFQAWNFFHYFHLLSQRWIELILLCPSSLLRPIFFVVLFVLLDQISYYSPLLIPIFILVVDSQLNIILVWDRLILYCPASPTNVHIFFLVCVCAEEMGWFEVFLFVFLHSSSHCSGPLGLKSIPDHFHSGSGICFQSKFRFTLTVSHYHLASAASLPCAGPSPRRKTILKDHLILLCFRSL